MPWQILSEQTDPAKVMLFYCIQSEHANLLLGWQVRYSFSPFSGSLSLSLSLTHFLSPVYPFIAKSNSTPTHTFLSHSLTHTHARTHSFPPLVSLAHVFHLVLPFLCLFLTSLYSQLSIGTIPANYPQCHSHYFPISAANLLHTFLSPTLADPSAPRQLLANFSSLSALKESKERNKDGRGRKKGKEMAKECTSQTLIRMQLQTGVSEVHFLIVSTESCTQSRTHMHAHTQTQTNLL